MALIQTRAEGNVGTIALNRYEKRNALGRHLIHQVIGALNEFEKARIRAVVLRSATNEKVWSAGHDVSELPRADVDPLPYTGPFEQLLRAVREFPAPTIAMIHGAVWGGACDLVLSCDLAFGDETCSFAVTPAKLGLPYNVDGFLTFMARLPLTVAKEMFFTANPISAAQAERAGLVNRIVPEAELEARVYETARTIATRSAPAVHASKEAFRVLSDAVAINPTTYEYLQGLRRSVYFGPDYREGIRSFLEKRSPRF